MLDREVKRGSTEMLILALVVSLLLLRKHGAPAAERA